jgi:hypothetical protein
MNKFGAFLQQVDFSDENTNNLNLSLPYDVPFKLKNL